MKGLWFVILFFFFSMMSIADDRVSIFTEPANPVKGESFKIIFKIKTKSDETPYISFDPGRAEVLGKSDHGHSVQTTIINGKVTTKREAVYEYSLITDRAGALYISDLKIEIDGELKKYKNLKVNVVRTPIRPKDFFLMAIPSKTEIFLGEGIDVNYYLYYRVRVGGLEIKAFPKLNGFLKRFHKVNEREETVEYNGARYHRSLRYSARVYPEKLGDLYVDSMVMNLQYQSRGQRNNPFGSFGAFGFGLRSLKSKSVRSKRVKIRVKPLPVENLPSNFTGLVGKHEFKLEIPNTKVIVNEAIELRLTVEGPGALENYNAPQIYYHDFLEEFDNKSELVELGKSTAKKIYDYTYLSRAPFKIDDRDFKFSYFDPEEEKYIEESIQVPGLTSAGSAIRPKSGGNTDVYEKKQQTGLEKKEKIDELKLIAPIFNKNVFSKMSNPLMMANVLTLAMVVFLSMILVWEKVRYSKVTDKSRDLVTSIKKNGISYGPVYKLILELGGDKQNVDPLSIIEKSKLSKSSKDYFLKLIKVSSGKTFSNIETTERVFFKKKYFNELLRVLSK